jgi:hypothetical protein
MHSFQIMEFSKLVQINIFNQWTFETLNMNPGFASNIFKCHLFVNFSFLDAFHMKYLLFLKDMLTQNVPLL